MIQPSSQPDYYTFSTDGNPEEWEGVEPLATAPLHSTTQAYRIFMTAEKLNILFEGDHPDSYAFYFDIDNSVTTGSADNPWTYAGFDFVVQDGSLYDLRGGSPIFVRLVEESAAAGYFEVAVPVSVLDLSSENVVFYTAANVLGENETLYFPSTDYMPVKFVRTLPSLTPSAVTVSNSALFPETQLIIRWQICAGCNGYVIERAENTPEQFSEVAKRNAFTTSYSDNDLTTGTTYYYRVYSFNSIGLSLPSPVLSGVPHAVTGLDNEPDNVILVYPNPVNDFLFIEMRSVGIYELELFNSMGNSLWTKEATGNNFQEAIDMSSLSPGLYMLRASGKYTYTFKLVKQ
jgi:hypothetical protein